MEEDARICGMPVADRNRSCLSVVRSDLTTFFSFPFCHGTARFSAGLVKIVVGSAEDSAVRRQ